MDDVAVVIPVLNEKDVIVETLSRLRDSGVRDIIVVDGGSEDGTSAAVAAVPGVALIRSQRGRGTQINAGVAASRAPRILVLHADTRLPADALALVRGELDRPDVGGGCFRLRYDDNGVILRFYGFLSRFETGMTTFGDQAFFFRKADFLAVGGMPDWPLFEDVELRRRIKTRGRFVKIKREVVSSARRFRRLGPIRAQVMNALLLAAFHLGVSPHRLDALYRARR